MTATDIRFELGRLAAERLDARDVGLDRDLEYMESLEAEIAGFHAAYVGAAVTEIASFRAQLSGMNVG